MPPSWSGLLPTAERYRKDANTCLSQEAAQPALSPWKLLAAAVLGTGAIGAAGIAAYESGSATATPTAPGARRDPRRRDDVRRILGRREHDHSHADAHGLGDRRS